CFGTLEYRPMLRVLQDRQRARGPSALVRFSVDRVRNAESGRLRVSQGAAEFDLVCRRRIRRSVGFALEFLEQPAARVHQARPAVGKIGMSEHLEAKTR